jgi:hypothetical protein
MATRLSGFAAEVHAYLVTQGVTITQRDEIEALQQHDEKVRIVWLTPGGRVAVPRQAGGALPSSGAANRNRACRTREERVEVHIFGADREEAESLMDRVIAAIHELAPDTEFSDYVYPQEGQRAKSGRVLRAHECVLIFDLRLPVSAEIAPLRTITGVTDICGTIQPDGSIVPQDEVPP